MGRKSLKVSASAKASSGASASASDHRIDPADGQVLTFDALRQKYANKYSKPQIKSYWSNECRSASAACTSLLLATAAPEDASKERKPPARDSQSKQINEAFEKAKKASEAELNAEAVQKEVEAKPDVEAVQKEVEPSTPHVQQAVDEESGEPLPHASAGIAMEGTSGDNAQHEDAIHAAPEATTEASTVEDEKPVVPEPEASGTRAQQQLEQSELQPEKIQLPQPESSETGAQQQLEEIEIQPEKVPESELHPEKIQVPVPDSSFGDLAALQPPSEEVVKKETPRPQTPEPALTQDVQSSKSEAVGPELDAKEAKPTAPRVDTVASPQRCENSPNNKKFTVDTVASPQRRENSPNNKKSTVGGVATITFSVPYQTSFGEQIVVVGNVEALGEWDPTKAAVMRWTDGHIWVTTVDLELPPAASGKTIEYKYVLLSHGRVKCWEECENRSLCQARSGSSLVCNNIWDDLSVAVIQN